MTHPNPELRPTASELLAHSSFSPVYKTVKDKHELKAAKQKIQLLEQQLQVCYILNCLIFVYIHLFCQFNIYYQLFSGCSEMCKGP
jgi:hypothetical protein